MGRPKKSPVAEATEELIKARESHTAAWLAAACGDPGGNSDLSRRTRLATLFRYEKEASERLRIAQVTLAEAEAETEPSVP